MKISRQTKNVPAVDISGKQPTVISTFCGTGGSSLGYHWAGFKELLAIDFEAHAVECFKLNFPDVPIWHKSVTDVTGQQIMDFCKIKWGELDVFDGSPPCQGFSTAGKRQVSDPRNDLFMQYCRLIGELGPKVFVMENVSGMAKGVMKGKFIQIIQQLKSMNYEVKCKQMNAMYYGVPQSRERMIFIGVRKDMKLSPIFPQPTKKLITFKQACMDLRGNRAEDRMTNDTVRRMSLRQPRNAWSTDMKIWKQIKGNTAGGVSLKWAAWDRVMGTLPKSEISLTGIVHPDRDRYISIAEAKRVCSFPDDWKFPNRAIGMARLGNAVMPKFMQAIATTIKDQILNHSE